MRRQNKFRLVVRPLQDSTTYNNNGGTFPPVAKRMPPKRWRPRRPIQPKQKRFRKVRPKKNVFDLAHRDADEHRAEVAADLDDQRFGLTEEEYAEWERAPNSPRGKELARRMVLGYYIGKRYTVSRSVRSKSNIRLHGLLSKLIKILQGGGADAEPVVVGGMAQMHKTHDLPSATKIKTQNDVRAMVRLHNKLIHLDVDHALRELKNLWRDHPLALDFLQRWYMSWDVKIHGEMTPKDVADIAYQAAHLFNWSSSSSFGPKGANSSSSSSSSRLVTWIPPNPNSLHLDPTLDLRFFRPWRQFGSSLPKGWDRDVAAIARLTFAPGDENEGDNDDDEDDEPDEPDANAEPRRLRWDDTDWDLDSDSDQDPSDEEEKKRFAEEKKRKQAQAERQRREDLKGDKAFIRARIKQYKGNELLINVLRSSYRGSPELLAYIDKAISMNPKYL